MRCAPSRSAENPVFGEAMDNISMGCARCEAPVEYELLEHIADLGIAVSGRDWPDLLARCAVALADLQYDPTLVEERQVWKLRLEFSQGDTLLVRWLNELIALREIEEFLWRGVEVELKKTQLSATLNGERFDETRHVPRSGLKAATYHQLSVEEVPEGLRARVIFDV
jgi:protein archease